MTVASETWRMLTLGTSPRRRVPGGLDACWHAAAGRLMSLAPRTRRALDRATRVQAMRPEYENLSDARLLETARRVREAFRRRRVRRADIVAGCAVIQEASVRTLGLRPHREQLAAALALHEGCVVEMATGEGKTLVAAMRAVLGGWRGRGCHVLTSNEYLANRDARIMGPLFEYLDLSVAAIRADMEPQERRHAYHAAITYCTSQDVAADYLRDQLAMGRTRRLGATLLAGIVDGERAGAGRLIMRGLDTAVVDEADSILVDEAVTPLILSGEAPNEQQAGAFRTAAAIAAELERGRHYLVDARFREVTLTRDGCDAVAEASAPLGGVWGGRRRSEELVIQALTARELYERDRQYVLDEGKVVIVDESTGRLMPERTWRAGLHQAIEAREALEITPPKVTLARISFQRFFRLYRHLCGMTGTAREARHEFWRVFDLPTVVLPTHRPCRRTQAPDRIMPDAASKWAAVLEAIETAHRQGRPVLVGTRSVDDSEQLSRRLIEAGLEHRVLNAVRHAEEAEVVAGAGERGRITVATNMAGRGTDIKLGEGVSEAGGLHVIATERHDSRRVDRQLFGRAGRQGDPGSAAVFVSIDDELWRRRAPALLGPLVRRCRWAWLCRTALTLAQRRAGRAAARQRRAVLRTDDWLDRNLGFSQSR